MAALAGRAEWREDSIVARFSREILPMLDATELSLAGLLQMEGGHGIPARLLAAIERG